VLTPFAANSLDIAMVKEERTARFLGVSFGVENSVMSKQPTAAARILIQFM
jgi:hypothetical protein